MNDRQRLEAIISVVCKYLPPDGIPIKDAMSEIISYVDPLPPLPTQEPAQEPVGWMCSAFGDDEVEYGLHQECENCVPLYTTPPQRTWVGLTPEDILDLFDEQNLYGSKLVEFTRAVEAKIKDKNNG